MTEHWERTVVTGNNGDRTITEMVLHRRGEDPMVLAFRRNLALAGCVDVRTETSEAFIQERTTGTTRRRAEIPRDDRTQEEWDW